MAPPQTYVTAHRLAKTAGVHDAVIIRLLSQKKLPIDAILFNGSGDVPLFLRTRIGDVLRAALPLKQSLK